MISRDVTRKIISAVLDYGLKFGLDAAGSFLGPAWPLVRPLVESLLKDMPDAISERFQSSQEAVEQAKDALKERSKELDEISKLLDDHGITGEWADTVLEKLDRISDDMKDVFLRASSVETKVDNILRLLTQSPDKKPGNIVIQGAQLEYVNFMHIPESAFPGFDLAPGSFCTGSIQGKHMPAGFMIYNFVLSNWNDEKCVVTRIMLKVLGEYPLTAGATVGELKPELAPYEDRAFLAAGVQDHVLFADKRFTYNADESDAFRVLLVFQKDFPQAIQKVQVIVYWANSEGDHSSYSTPLFLASLNNPDLSLAHQKFRIG